MTREHAEFPRLLVVDDDPEMLELLDAALTRSGYEVTRAASGTAAWELLNEQQFRVVLVDWLMPDLDGLELVRRLRARADASYTYVIVITVQSGVPRFLEAMDAGADDYLTKPLDLDVLGARLRVAERMLALRGEIHQLRAILPMCMYCRKLRDDRGQWLMLEEYVELHGGTRVSHGMCEECFRSRAP